MPIATASRNVCKSNYKQKKPKPKQKKTQLKTKPTNKHTKAKKPKTKLVFLPLSYYFIHGMVQLIPLSLW